MTKIFPVFYHHKNSKFIKNRESHLNLHNWPIISLFDTSYFSIQHNEDRFLISQLTYDEYYD